MPDRNLFFKCKAMKTTIISLLITLFLIGCITSKVGKLPQEGRTYAINPNYGIDSVFLGESTTKNVISIFGKAKIKRSWRPNDYPIELGEVIKAIEYPDLGIRFIFDHRRGRFSKKTLREVIIDSTSQIKTPMGNGIGSSLRDIKNEYGETKFSRGTFPTFKMSHLSYDLQNKYGHYVTMHFIQGSIVDSSAFKVKKIWLHYQ